MTIDTHTCEFPQKQKKHKQDLEAALTRASSSSSSNAKPRILVLTLLFGARIPSGRFAALVGAARRCVCKS